MTPYALSILMHHYVSPCRHDRWGDSGYESVVRDFVENGVLAPLENGSFHVTPKGNAFCELILSTPVPVVAWLDPRTKTIVPERGLEQ